MDEWREREEGADKLGETGGVYIHTDAQGEKTERQSERHATATLCRLNRFVSPLGNCLLTQYPERGLSPSCVSVTRKRYSLRRDETHFCIFFAHLSPFSTSILLLFYSFFRRWTVAFAKNERWRNEENPTNFDSGGFEQRNEVDQIVSSFPS